MLFRLRRDDTFVFLQDQRGRDVTLWGEAAAAGVFEDAGLPDRPTAVRGAPCDL
jgi:hypothetical protein